jgi:hypothetical protein
MQWQFADIEFLRVTNFSEASFELHFGMTNLLDSPVDNVKASFRWAIDGSTLREKKSGTPREVATKVVEFAGVDEAKCVQPGDYVSFHLRGQPLHDVLSIVDAMSSDAYELLLTSDAGYWMHVPGSILGAQIEREFAA